MSYVQNEPNKLVQLSNTRQASREVSLSNLIKAFPAALKNLSEINMNDKSVAGQKTCSFLKAAKEFDYLFTVHSMHEIFQITSILNKHYRQLILQMQNIEYYLQFHHQKFCEVINILKAYMQNVFQFIENMESKSRNFKISQSFLYLR